LIIEFSVTDEFAASGIVIVYLGTEMAPNVVVGFDCQPRKHHLDDRKTIWSDQQWQHGVNVRDQETAGGQIQVPVVDVELVSAVDGQQ
jgi:hypothetical protein